MEKLKKIRDVLTQPNIHVYIYNQGVCILYCVGKSEISNKHNEMYRERERVLPEAAKKVR